MCRPRCRPLPPPPLLLLQLGPLRPTHPCVICPSRGCSLLQVLARFGDDTDAYRHYAPLLCRARSRESVADGERLFRNTLPPVAAEDGVQAFVVVRDISLFSEHLKGRMHLAAALPSTPTSASSSRAAVSLDALLASSSVLPPRP